MATNGTVQLSLLADSPVNPSQSQEEGRERRMVVTSGQKCVALFKRQDPVGWLVRTLLTSQAWDLTARSLTWKPSTTPLGRLYFRLVPSKPRTSGKGRSLLPTPTSSPFDRGEPTIEMWERRQQNRVNTGREPYKPPLAVYVQIWPTPKATGWSSEPSQIAKGKQVNLVTALGVGGRINPAWVERLMGFPAGWTEVGNYPYRVSRKRRRTENLD